MEKTREELLDELVRMHHRNMALSAQLSQVQAENAPPSDGGASAVSRSAAPQPEAAQSSKSLSVEAAMLGLVTKHSREGIVLIRLADGIVLYANRSLGTMFQIDWLAAIGARVPDFFRDSPQGATMVRYLAEQKSLDDYEMLLHRFDGGSFWAAVTLDFVKYRGEVALLAQFRVIDAMVMLRERMGALEKALAARQARKAEFPAEPETQRPDPTFTTNQVDMDHPVTDTPRNSAQSGSPFDLERAASELLAEVDLTLEALDEQRQKADDDYEYESEAIDLFMTPDDDGRIVIGYEGERRRILIVDGQTHLHLIDLLALIGFDVYEAETIDDAMRKAQAFPPDAIIVMLPGEEGLMTLERLQQFAGQQGSRLIALGAGLPEPVAYLLDLIHDHLDLQWIYDEETLGSALVAIPPLDQLERIRRYAGAYNIQGIMQVTHEMTEDGQYAPFARKLRRLAQRFNMDEIYRFIVKQMA